MGEPEKTIEWPWRKDGEQGNHNETMGEPQENLGKYGATTEELCENHGRSMKEPLENHVENMEELHRQPWRNHNGTIGEPQGNYWLIMWEPLGIIGEPCKEHGGSTQEPWGTYERTRPDNVHQFSREPRLSSSDPEELRISERASPGVSMFVPPSASNQITLVLNKSIDPK